MLSPRLQAIQDLIDEMGGMDGEKLKKKKPSVTVIDIKSSGGEPPEIEMEGGEEEGDMKSGYDMMKKMDPNSVVREGEMEEMEDKMPMMGGAMGKFKKLIRMKKLLGE